MRCLHTRTSHKVLTHTHTHTHTSHEVLTHTHVPQGAYSHTHTHTHTHKHTHTSHEVLTHEQRKRLVCVKMKEEGIEAHARDDETD